MVLETCPDWWDPLAVMFDDADGDPLLVLAPYYAYVVETVVPLAVRDVLTMRAWGFAKDFLDAQPLPVTVLEWQSRWRNFVEQIWRLVHQHGQRAWVAEKPKQRGIVRKKPVLKL